MNTKGQGAAEANPDQELATTAQKSYKRGDMNSNAAIKEAMTFKPKASYSYDDLIACGHGTIFGAGNARLPLPPMLMFDRITEVSAEGGAHGKGVIKAEFDIKPSLWFFECHFES